MKFLQKYSVWLAACCGLLLLSVCLVVDAVQVRTPDVNRAKKIIEKRLHASERKARKIINHPGLIRQSDNYVEVRSLLRKLEADPSVYYYIYKDNKLTYWSSNTFIPNNIDKLSEHDIRFIKEDNGFYQVLHQESADGRVNVYALIPVYNQYSGNNQFLKNGFVWNHPLLQYFIISSKETARTTAVTDIENKLLFSVRVKDNIHGLYNPYIIVLELIGLVLLFWAVFQLLRKLLLQGKSRLALALIVVVVIGTDVLVNFVGIFSITRASLLFSSNLFASSYLADSLGVLFIRVLLFSWAVSLLRYAPVHPVANARKYWLLLLPVTLFYVLLYVMHSVIQNSVISFNFYAVNSLDRYTFVGLIIFGLGFSSLLYLIKWTYELGYDEKMLPYALVFSVTGAVISYFLYDFANGWYMVFVTLWLITFLVFFYYEKQVFQSNEKYKFLANLILLSFIGFLTSVVVVYNTGQKEIEKRKYRMKELVSERDIGEEYSLMEAEKLILQDNFIKTYFRNPYLYNVDIDQRMSTKYFKLFSKRYSINTYSYNKDGWPLMGLMPKEFQKLNGVRFYRKAEKLSPHFYYLSFKENGEKYLGYFPVEEDSVVLGYLFVEFIPKIFNSYSAYPELLHQQKNYYDEEFDNYSYAIYESNYLVKQKGDFEYEVDFNFPVKQNVQFTFHKSNGYSHMIYYSKNKQVVLSEKDKPILGTFSVFSYLVIFFLIFFTVLDITGFSDRFWGEGSVRSFFSSNTLQKQIQNSMIGLVLFSLAVIGLVTMVYFQYQYNIFHNSRLLKKVNSVMKNTAQYYVDEYPVYGAGTFDKVIRQYIKPLSTIHALDINVYDVNGELLQTSQPEIFKRKLSSSRMDATAYYNLVIKGKSKFVQDESIGGLTYLSAYQPFRSNGKILGYFNFPYYGKQKSFREDISYFLVALVNVYVLFLIAAALLAVFLSRSITNSLTLIADSIRSVQFGKTNSPIQWKNDDEIGWLVKQYNAMLAELEKSAGLLAKSEREGAWREMAKQVAHEIKNPLTPMKLSIQHLQRAIKDNSPDIKELTERISHRLIEQIDTLSNIATAFSDFAKMPQGELVKIEAAPILVSTVELFNELENLEIHIHHLVPDSFVKGDKEQLMRVFTNIIKNASQSIPEQQQGIIDIDMLESEEDYVISIKDNGIGIAEEKRSHIFEPNFTTKSSGTGLGLAISKNIVERMGGKIWFETEVGQYSIFYIRLPKWNELYNITI